MAQLFLIASFPMALGIAWSSGGLKPRQALVLAALYVLFPLGWITPLLDFLYALVISKGSWQAGTRYFKARLMSLLTFSWKYRPLAASLTFYLELLFSGAFCFAVGKLAKMAPKPRLIKICFGIGLATVCLLGALNLTGALGSLQAAWSAADQSRLFQMHIDSGGTIEYAIRFAPVQEAFSSPSLLMGSLRIGSRLPNSCYILLTAGLGCLYCAERIKRLQWLAFMGIALGAACLTALIIPASAELHLSWSQALLGRYGISVPYRIVEIIAYLGVTVAISVCCEALTKLRGPQ